MKGLMLTLNLHSMYTRIGNIDFPTEWCKGRTLEELRDRFTGKVLDKFIVQLHSELNPKQKQPKKKRKVKTKVDKPKTEEAND